MSKYFYDRSMNDHNHATPQRNTVEEMMVHRNYQAIDVAIHRSNPLSFRDSFEKRFNGMLIQDKSGKAILTVADPENPHLSKTVPVDLKATSNEVFALASDLANEIVTSETIKFYKRMGFVG